MRNDAHDELDHVPSLTPDLSDRDDLLHDEPAPRRPVHGRGGRAEVAKGVSTGPLWALVGALTIALGGLGWWSFQQISLMEQSLVATQESFARISEEAAGRIQDISGKVVATESSVTSGSEALKLQVKQLENKLAELGRQQQSIADQQGGLGKRIDQLAEQLKASQGATSQFDSRLKTLAGEQDKLKAGIAEAKSAQGELGKLDSRIKALGGEVEALKKQGNPSQAISRLEQDLLVLRSELDNRPAASANTAEFDAFRAQMTRNINTLQSQVVNLQQQIDNR